MNAVVTTDLDQLKSWLDELQIAYYECDSCQALHLPHLQYISGIFDAKIDILEDVLVFTAIAELKPSAIVPLMANLSQINASSLFIKTFLEISDENLPKLVFCQSFPVAAGISLNSTCSYKKQKSNLLKSLAKFLITVSCMVKNKKMKMKKKMKTKMLR